ncbi:acyl carrier protein [Streptomyces lonarensis]|uniref:Acyl carrier protein n=2 Tax=Streptomyces lonarensis TaxID=700599 RepID=A0A7X6D4V0_9ACTN|nr:acyl carrier protein [Streptomyces lonarensis]NJQ08187.1 acyl carrier protein [Streptomyces lonarensis]
MTTAAATGQQYVTAVVAALSEVLGEPLPDATPATRLFDELHLDSTSVLSLLMALEDSLDLEVDPESLEQHHLETVGSLAGYVAEIR